MRYYSSRTITDITCRAHARRQTFTTEAGKLHRRKSAETDAAPLKRRRPRAPARPRPRGRRGPRGLCRRRAPRPHGGEEVSAPEILLRRPRLATLRGHLPAPRILPDAR